MIVYDSNQASRMPPDGDVYCCYTDGIYSNEAAVRAAYPGKPVWRISALGRSDADVIDVEPGCVWPPEAAIPWLAARPHAKVYCGLANLRYVSGVLGTDHDYWVAHYTNRAHICDNNCIPRGSVPDGVNIIGVQYGGDSNVGGYHFDISYFPDGLNANASVSARLIVPVYSAPSEEDDDMSDAQYNTLWNEIKAIQARLDGDGTPASGVGPGVQDIRNSEGLIGYAVQAVRNQLAELSVLITNQKLTAPDVDEAALAEHLAASLPDGLAKAVADEIAKRLAA